MKRIQWKNWKVFSLIAAALIVALAYPNVHPLTASPVYAAEQAAAADRHTITVNGEGQLFIKPDVAYINLAILTKADTANEAQTQNAQQFDKLQNVLFDTYQLEKKDVKTTGFQVQPVYSYEDKEPKITGYTANQNIQVTYRNLDNIGTFLDAASKAGVNQINGIQFDTEKRQDYEIDAINAAMNNAEAKAKAIAQHAGKELKQIVNVVQNGGGAPIRFENIGMYDMKAAAASNASAGTSISPGELKITTTVSVQYEF